MRLTAVFRTAALLFLVMIPVCLRAERLDDLMDQEVPVARAVEAKSKVFVATTSHSLVAAFRPNPVVVQQMLDLVITAVTGKKTVREAWASLVKPEDVVGIKVAAAPGRDSGTHVELVRAICRGLQSAGIPASRIIVWDRNRDDLLAAGYSEHDPDFKLEWIDPSTGYDREAMITAPVLGRLIWGDSRFGDKQGMRFEDMLSSGVQLSSTSYFATVLSKKVTKVINVPSLCDSYLTGMNGALANMTLWNVDNWRRFTKEPNYGDPFLGEIYADPTVHDKVVVNILDALAIQFAGGPQPYPNFVREMYSIYASRDPVALDATALRLVDEYRKANKLPPASKMATHIQSAADMGLGNAVESGIEEINVGARVEQ